MQSEIRLTKSQTRELLEDGSVTIKQKGWVNIVIERNENGEVSSHIENPINNIKLAVLEKGVKGYFIHAWYPTDDKRFENDLEITLNKDLEMFEDQKDATQCFFDLVKTARTFHERGKTNQFELLELFVKKSNGKTELICRWEYQKDIITWGKGYGRNH